MPDSPALPNPPNDTPRAGGRARREGGKLLLSNDIGTRLERSGSTILFLAIALVIAFDLVDDWKSGSPLLHLGVEGVVLLLAALGVAQLWARFQVERRNARGLRGRVAEARAAAEDWRRGTERLLAGLGRAISAQFSAWSFTEAESEVALLLLKGLSLREIADVRETSNRTVRQQSLAVYRKAGVAGRAELSAFFLEDLLLPQGTYPRDPSQPPKSSDVPNG